jgi:glycosyltransferase involved in cell wall biosynthesis
MRTAVFSIIAPNYRHFARVLMASLREQQPDWERFVLIVGDGLPGEELFTSVPLDALPLPDRRRFLFRYTLLELSTAVKPWMFEHLFARGYDRVVYLDPDIFVYSPLVELDAVPDETLLTLTPHLTGSIEGDDHPSERSILIAGSYNLGFLAVRRQPQLPVFLAWWQKKLEFQCVVDTANGLFVDQKWIDLTPGLFAGVSILRHDGYNVAYWNLRQRTVAEAGGNFAVNGQPLRFFHFSGFNPAIPSRPSAHDPRLTFADVGDARRLFKEYGAEVRKAGSASFRKAGYSYGTFADGTPIAAASRVAYRNSLELQEAAGADPFQRPELFNGLRDASPPLSARLGLASYRFLSRARPLVLLFPRSFRTSLRERLLGMRKKKAVVRAGKQLQPGLNIAGYFDHESGVGESARLCRNACETVGLAGHLIDVDKRGGAAQQAVHTASIFHVNADQLLIVRDRLPHLFDSGAYNIGCWHWELPELPDDWIASAAPLHEIWAPSAFIQSAIGRKVTIPVVHMPHGIEVTEIEACSPEELGVPRGRFTFLCMFDFNSVMERKNPRGAAEAFRRAFAADSSAALLIKTSNADRHPAEFAELQDAVRGIPNVHLVDKLLSRAKVNGLIASCDAVVSLHRSEGFGLILAEAMYLGKAVVATGWSGNIDFMNAGNSCPVGYELVKLQRPYAGYIFGEWAEPDLDHAAYLMRRLVDDAAWRMQLSARGRDTIHSHFSPEAAGIRYQRRLQFLGLLSAAGAGK